MSIYDPKYPAGTEATVSSAGKNVDKLNKAGMPVNGGDKVVKVQPTNDATLVTIGGGGVVVFLDFNGKVYKLDGKEASISPLFNKSSSGQGITWNVNTLEAAACLGLFMDADIEYEKLGDPNRPTEEDVKIVKKIEKHLTNGQDYDQKGVDGILSILSDPNKRNIADLTETLKMTPDVMNSLDTSKFNIKEVEFDNSTHYWEGDYDTGSVKPMHDKQIIYERAVNTSANVRVLEKWPLHKQINAIIEMLDQADIPNTPKITALKEHIEAIKQETIEMKKVYEEDDAYEYIKVADEIAKADKLRDL